MTEQQYWETKATIDAAHFLIQSVGAATLLNIADLRGPELAHRIIDAYEARCVEQLTGSLRAETDTPDGYGRAVDSILRSTFDSFRKDVDNAYE